MMQESMCVLCFVRKMVSSLKVAFQESNTRVATLERERELSIKHEKFQEAKSIVTSLKKTCEELDGRATNLFS